ncbi:zona pellucida sperm-binding protein 3d.2 isoform X2 [Notolabrus celidotus]|uniref:zona pellucida sperm-binding protein 3d.2 isoform X2 n=1 Tax=Notolabrus celidotus TaxID=1203425 RepID=UPI0014903603|nr:zona pellucida sperm-binding protein 3d.2 isoform X2 [Notolabrus celidotus]
MVHCSLIVTLSFMLITTPTVGALTQPRQAMKEVSRRETPLLPPPYLHLPVSVDSRLPLVEKEHFSPVRGTGKEPLPEPVREVLLPVRPKTSPPNVSGDSVRTSCLQNKMLVQVERSVFGTDNKLQSHVKLGTCRASTSTRDYINFEYDLDMCGTKQMIINNQLAYSNTLQYDPPKLQRPIRRSAPFSLPVLCYYNRYQYSYKIGYKPKMRMSKIFKPMKNQAKFILTPRNAQWERLLPSDQYVLGKPMYFEAEAPSMSQNKRLYVHQCYATPEKSHTSTPRFDVVRNFGCMVESKESRSRFIPYKSSAARFSVDAFLFKGMTGQLYMHCSLSVGSSTPTPTAKSCNYDTKARRWVELYGKASVCACCDSICNSAASTVTKIVSSRPWTIGQKVKPTAAPKRKRVSTTTSTTTSTTETAMTREVTKMKTTLQPEAIEVTKTGKVENTVKELEWPFGGEGVLWVELEEEKEKEVKGSAVVEEEEEEEEEEEVTRPRTIFEEIFGFDK